ncbi:MAG: hypothetical protein ABWZ82_11700 [Candidatus Limnocylindrales bacterium]
MRPIPRLTMAVALAISWASMLAHNLYELPLSPVDPESFGPLVVAVALGLAYAARPDSFLVATLAFAWGVLNLVIGGVLSVLPLSFLPFVPEQTLTHYGAHVVYTLGQLPLVVVAYRAARIAGASRKRSAMDTVAR